MPTWSQIKIAVSLLGVVILGFLFSKSRYDARQAKLTLKYNIAEARVSKNKAKRKKLDEESKKVHTEYANARAAYRVSRRNRTPKS